LYSLVFAPRNAYVVGAVAFPVAAFVGGTWLLAAVHVLVRLALGIGWLIVLAGVATAFRGKTR
jgi:hypothetical protein